MKKLLILIASISLNAFANFVSPVITNKVRMDIKNEKELKEILDKTFDKQTASDFFDKIQHSKVSFAILNDYNFSDANHSDPNVPADDLGKTHGIEITYTKNIAPFIDKDEYYVSISYSTDLYTNSTEPEVFQNDYHDVLYRSEEGVYIADQWFKEENFFKVLVGKIESKDAYYWKGGIGFQEINAEDKGRGIILSSVEQQTFHHEFLNRDVISYREYNNIAQEDASELGVMIEGELGRDFTLLESDARRSWLRVGAKSRLTTVNDASNIGVYGTLGHDYVSNGTTGFRIEAGVSGEVYSDGSVYSDSYVGIGMHIKPLKVAVNLKYIVPFTKDPGYLNALPMDFTDRDTHAAPNEPIYWLNLEGKF